MKRGFQWHKIQINMMNTYLNKYTKVNQVKLSAVDTTCKAFCHSEVLLSDNSWDGKKNIFAKCLSFLS